MNEKVKIEKSFSNMFGYCLKWSYIIVFIGLIVLFAIFAIQGAWSVIIYAVLIPLVGILAVFGITFLIVRKTDNICFIISFDTVKKTKGENEIFKIQDDEIEEVKFSKINLIDIDPSISVLIIKLKKKVNNKDEIRIFTKRNKIDEIQKVFGKERILK